MSTTGDTCPIASIYRNLTGHTITYSVLPLIAKIFLYNLKYLKFRREQEESSKYLIHSKVSNTSSFYALISQYRDVTLYLKYDYVDVLWSF